MKIKQIHLAKLDIPLIRPFITALRRTEFVHDVVVIIETYNGMVGYGSAAATPVITGDSIESIIGAVELISHKLVGKDIINFEELLNVIQNTLVANSSAKAALDIALHDLIAKKLNVPLYQFLGGGEPKLKILATISVKSVDEMVTDTKRLVSEGFETLKIKIGLNPEEDIERLKAIRAAAPENIDILCDANQSWDAKSALKVIDMITKNNLKISMVEQPVKAWDLANLKFVRDNSRIPVYADESAFGIRDAAKIISGNIADGINIKLMKAGGIYPARTIYDMVTSHNSQCMVSCMLESPIGLAAMASFAASRKINYIDLDPISMIKYNPVKGGLSISGATLSLSENPGLGIDKIEGLEIIKVIGA